MNEVPVAENQSVAVQDVTPTAAPAIPVVEKEPMKIGVEAVQLAAAVAAVKPFISRHTSLPILSNIKITGHAKTLTFEANNLDCSIVTSVIASVSRNGGRTTLPVRQLADILKGCKDDVWIETDKHDKISIASGGTSSTVLGLPAEEYPAIAPFRADREEQIPQGLFKTMLDRVRRCQSTDETRYVLNGVLLERKAGKVRVVATDGREDQAGHCHVHAGTSEGSIGGHQLHHYATGRHQAGHCRRDKVTSQDADAQRIRALGRRHKTTDQTTEEIEMKAIIEALQGLLEDHRSHCPDCHLVEAADKALAEFKPLRIVVQVEGGCVTGVWANHEGEGYVVDHDNAAVDEEVAKEHAPVIEEIKTMKAVWP